MYADTYAARLADAVARYDARPTATHFQHVEHLAAAIHRRWPTTVLLLPIPPPPVVRRPGRPERMTA